MRVFSFAAAAITCLALASPALAQSEEDVLARIEELHGLSAEFGEAFAQLQDSILFGDPSGLADLGEYPLTVEANGEVYVLIEAQDIIDNFDALLTPDTQAALANQDFDDLIVTSEGVSLANGAVWMNVVCVDDACETGYWAITGINN